MPINKIIVRNFQSNNRSSLQQWCLAPTVVTENVEYFLSCQITDKSYEIYELYESYARFFYYHFSKSLVLLTIIDVLEVQHFIV